MEGVFEQTSSSDVVRGGWAICSLTIFSSSSHHLLTIFSPSSHHPLTIPPLQTVMLRCNDIHKNTNITLSTSQLTAGVSLPPHATPIHHPSLLLHHPPPLTCFVTFGKQNLTGMPWWSQNSCGPFFQWAATIPCTHFQQYQHQQHRG